MFEQATILKNKVICIIHTSNSIKEDIESLKKSISHLSSVILESAKISLVRATSLVNNDDKISSFDEEYSSPQISSE